VTPVLSEREVKAMTEKRNAKYFVTADKPNLVLPSYRLKVDPKYVKRILHVDADTVPGAEFYNEAKWILPGSKDEIKQVDSHTHAFGELIGFFGFNYDDIQDLGAEIEFTVDNETHKITKSFAAYIPAGIQHGPLIIRNVVRPIFHFTAGDCKIYE
jgi:hypothetical protein